MLFRSYVRLDGRGGVDRMGLHVDERIAGHRRLVQGVHDAGVPHTRLRVAGNLPYNVGAVILVTLAALRRDGVPFTDATIMLQREVADRLIAAPGTHDYGMLTIFVRQWALAERILAVPPGAFRPAPSVQSAIVRLTCRPDPVRPRDQGRFEQLVRGLFARRRKTLLNALRGSGAAPPGDAGDALAASGLDPQRRPETDRKSTRLNSSHVSESRMPSSA